MLEGATSLFHILRLANMTSIRKDKLHGTHTHTHTHIMGRPFDVVMH